MFVHLLVGEEKPEYCSQSDRGRDKYAFNPLSQYNLNLLTRLEGNSHALSPDCKVRLDQNCQASHRSGYKGSKKVRAGIYRAVV